MTTHKLSPVINLVPRAILNWTRDAWESMETVTAFWPCTKFVQKIYSKKRKKY